jgi:DNA adenine methylase
MMPQTTLFPDVVPSWEQRKKIVNVASVPQRSPFRYPGGKTWLVPLIRKWLAAGKRPAEFIESFAGGAIVSLTVAAENLADHVTMVELDDQVAAVWETIISGEGKWLANRIMSFELTAESLAEELSKSRRVAREIGFQTILKNRTFHGGILAAGAAPLKYGENGKGIKSRWYPETLKNRILGIDAIRHRINFIHGDGLKVIKENQRRRDAVFFVDPPYTAPGKRAGRRLYTHFDLDHEELFSLLEKCAGDFLITYDDAESVRDLAKLHGFDTELVPMKNTHHAEMMELLIGRDLDWARSKSE